MSFLFKETCQAHCIVIVFIERLQTIVLSRFKPIFALNYVVQRI